MGKRRMVSYFVLAVILIGCSFVSKSSQAEVSSSVKAVDSSATAQSSIEMSSIPHFDTFEDLILNLNGYYSFLKLMPKQYDMINAYIANAELSDSLERQAFLYNQESLVENLKMALDDIANMKGSMLSQSVTETERSIIKAMVENLVSSNIVYGFDSPTQINPYDLVNYCCYKQNNSTIHTQKIAEILTQDFGSAFLVYPLPESFSLSNEQIDWEISGPILVSKVREQYQSFVSVYRQIEGEAIKVDITYTFEKKNQFYQVVSSRLNPL